jgi:glutathione peroxidase
MKVRYSAMPIADIQTERVKKPPVLLLARLELRAKLELRVPLPADIPLKTIDDHVATVGDFAGRALLIVNVASQCGFTPQFCKDSYDVTFPMFAKVEVNGPNAHPLFKALKHEAPGILGTKAIKWNFTKFLVDRQARVVRRYAPGDRPETLAKDIEAVLG